MSEYNEDECVRMLLTSSAGNNGFAKLLTLHCPLQRFHYIIYAISNCF